MKTYGKYHWFFILMLWSGVALGAYSPKYFLDTGKDWASSRLRYGVMHDPIIYNPKDEHRFLSEEQLSKYPERIVQDYKIAVGAANNLARHIQIYWFILGAVAFFHIVVGAIGIFATTSRTKQDEE